MRRLATADNAVRCGLLALFLLLTLPGLDRPGLSNDEAFDGLVSSHILQRADAIERRAEFNHYAVVGGRVLPVMSEHYVGAVMTYYLRPFLAVSGLSVGGLRLASVLWSALGLLLLYELCLAWFGRRAAVLAALLTATNLLFLQYSRVSFHREELLLIPFLLGALLCLARFAETKRGAYLHAAAFLLGLGLTAKLTFLWYLTGLAGACLLFRRELGLTGLTRARWSAAGLSFCAGAAFLIHYNVFRPGATFRLLWESLQAPTWKGGADNLRYLENLVLRIEHAGELLRGDIVVRESWGAGAAAPVDAWAPVILVMGLLALAWVGAVSSAEHYRAARPRDVRRRRGAAAERVPHRVLFLYVLYGLVFLQTPFTVSSLEPGHMTILLPLPQVALALLLDLLARKLEERPAAVGACYACVLAPMLVFHLGMHRHYFLEMRRDGGERRWSSAVYGLAGYLEAEGILAPVVFGFALRENLAFATGRRVRPIICRSASEEDVRAAYAEASLEAERLHWLFAGTGEEVPGLTVFQEFVAKEGREARLLKKFRNRAGRVVYRLFEAGPPPEPPIAWLASFLKDGDVRARERATRLLLGHAPRHAEALSPLAGLLGDEDPAVRSMVSGGLAGIPSAAEVLAPLLDGDPLARVAVAGTLLRLEAHRETAMRVLEEALGDPAWRTRFAAESALLSAGEAAPVARWLVHERVPARNERASGGARVAALRSAAADMDLGPGPRREAVEALGTMGATAALPEFVGALYDPEREVRLAAVEALGGLGTRARAAGPHVAALLTHPSREFRHGAMWALAGMGGRAGRGVLPELAAALRDEHAGVRMLAAHFCGRLGSTPVVGALIPALRDPEYYVRLEAVRALGRLGTAARVSAPALERAIEEDPGLRHDAGRALARVRGGRW